MFDPVFDVIDSLPVSIWALLIVVLSLVGMTIAAGGITVVVLGIKEVLA